MISFVVLVFVMIYFDFYDINIIMNDVDYL